MSVRLAILGILLSLALFGCGEKLCVGGVGDCGFDNTKIATGPVSGTPGAPGSPAGSGSNLVIWSQQPATISAGSGTITFQAASGQAPYTFSISFPPTGGGTIDPSTGVYRPPAQLTSGNLMRVQVRVTDRTNAWVEMRINVTQ